jgi:hypothetical protein
MNIIVSGIVIPMGEHTYMAELAGWEVGGHGRHDIGADGGGLRLEQHNIVELADENLE